MNGEGKAPAGRPLVGRVAARGTFRGTRRISEYAQVKPAGGFCFVPAMALIAAWWAYKRGILGLPDVRVWLAFFEVRARRCGDPHPRPLVCVEHEVATLVGSPATHVIASIRRLQQTAFLRRSKTAFDPADGLAHLTTQQLQDLQRTIGQVGNHCRLVPVPRRVVRTLCSLNRPVVIATGIGHLLRCMYYRDGKCAPDGRCKATWIADVFEVDGRNVKAARRLLVDAGLLFMDPTDQISMNRWGPRVRFNLEWSAAGQSLLPAPPRRVDSQRRSPPPREDRELASRLSNQQPGGEAPANLGPGARDSGRPSLRHVTLADLQQPNRTAALFAEAVRVAGIRDTANERLNFFAAAEHAKARGIANPCGLFVWLLRRRRWEHLTLQDEDRARIALRGLNQDAGMSRQISPKTPPPPGATRSVASPSTVAPQPAGKVLLDCIRTVNPALANVATMLQPSTGIPVRDSCTRRRRAA